MQIAATIPDALVDRIKQHEGFRAKPYQCNRGVWTIGYGVTSIEEDEAETLLIIKLHKLRAKLQYHISYHSEAVQGVLVEMAFQMGIRGLFGFRKMWLALDAGNYGLAAAEMLDSEWARKDSPGRAKKLAEIMRAG